MRRVKVDFILQCSKNLRLCDAYLILYLFHLLLVKRLKIHIYPWNYVIITITNRFQSTINIFKFAGKCKGSSKYEKPVIKKIAFFLKEYLWYMKCKWRYSIRYFHLSRKFNHELYVSINEWKLQFVIKTILWIDVGLNLLFGEIHLRLFLINAFKNLFGGSIFLTIR